MKKGFIPVFIIVVSLLSLSIFLIVTKVLRDHYSFGVKSQIGEDTSCALREDQAEMYSQYYTKKYKDFVKYLNNLGFSEIKDNYTYNGDSIKVDIDSEKNENVSLFKGNYNDLTDFVIIVEHYNKSYSEPCAIVASLYWEKSDWIWIKKKEKEQVHELANLLEKWGDDYPDINLDVNYPAEVPDDLFFYYSDETGGALRVQTETVLSGKNITIKRVIDGEYKEVEYDINQEQLNNIYDKIIEKDLLNYDFTNWSEDRNICNCLDCGPQAEHKFELRIDNTKNEMNFIETIDECHIKYNSDEDIVREIENLILNYINVI